MSSELFICSNPIKVEFTHPLYAAGRLDGRPPDGAAVDAGPPREGVVLLQHVDRPHEHGEVEAQHQRDGGVEEHLC